MNIYKLTPVNVDNPSWRYSTYRGDAVVRASDERRARALADMAFNAAAMEMSPAQATSHSLPWSDRALTKATLIEKSKFQKEGPEAILSPEDY